MQTSADCSLADGEFCDSDFLLTMQERYRNMPADDVRSIYDLARRHVLERLFVGMRADRLMRPVVPLRPDMSLAEAAKSLEAQEIKGAPVTDSEGCVIGFLSESDYLRHFKLHRMLAVLLQSPELSVRDKLERPGGVREAMASPVIMVRREARVTDIAAVLHYHTWRSLPVVDSDDHLLGMLQRRDFLAVTLNGETP